VEELNRITRSNSNLGSMLEENLIKERNMFSLLRSCPSFIYVFATASNSSFVGNAVVSLASKFIDPAVPGLAKGCMGWDIGNFDKQKLGTKF
jgi:hypothetical protein